MKYGLLTDIHIGYSKDSKIILKYQKEAFNEALGIFLDNGVKEIVILGDTFDRRHSNTTFILNVFLEDFLTPLLNCFNKIYFIVGNHDMHYTNTRSCNIMDTLLKYSPSKIEIINEIKRINKDILLVPWICNENDIMKLHEERLNKGILLGHLEINGFRMVRNGIKCYDGLESDIFSNFEMVVSGHFHLRNTIGNITYLGTMTPLNWSEYGSDHGVHILDSNKGTLNFFPISVNMFNVIEYEDKCYDIDELEIYRNKIVKIIIKNEEDEFLNDLTNSISNICHSYKVERTLKSIYSNDGEFEEVIRSEDENLILEKYIENRLPNSLKSKLFKKIYDEVYTIAISRIQR